MVVGKHNEMMRDDCDDLDYWQDGDGGVWGIILGAMGGHDLCGQTASANLESMDGICLIDRFTTIDRLARGVLFVSRYSILITWARIVERRDCEYQVPACVVCQ